MASFMSGVVKAVPSGDTVVVVGPPKGGPPPEKTIKLSSIAAPLLGWKERGDEPFAWAAREALRKKCIGKRVTFKIESRNAGAGSRNYGEIFLDGTSLTEWLVAEGWAKVRSKGADDNPLKLLEEEAEQRHLGMFTEDEEAIAAAVREVHFTGSFNGKQLFEEVGGKPLNAVVDQVRDGASIRCVLLDSFHHVTLFLSGVRCPRWVRQEDGEPDKPQPFAPEAKYFTEIRLLNRDVQVVLERVDNRGNMYGSVLIANGNITEVLLKEGLATVSEFSAAYAGTLEKLRECEKLAKQKQVRLWKTIQLPTPSIRPDERLVAGVITGVPSGDSVLLTTNGEERKIFLSSIRVPRLRRDGSSEPWAFEAKEFLRKKAIGKKVKVELDFIRPGSEDYSDKVCGSVFVGGKNVALQMVLAGYATVVFHKPEEERSGHYDELIVAQVKAESQLNGQHNKKKKAPVHRLTDVSRNVEAANTILGSLEGKRLKGVVDFVINGARFKIYIPKEDMMIPLVLEAVRCPRYTKTGGRPRKDKDGKAMEQQESEEFGEEAYLFSQGLCMQREVEFIVAYCNQGGTFVGNIFLENGANLGELLLAEGLGYSASERALSRSEYYSSLSAAEESAREAKLKYWSKEPVKVEESVDVPTNSTSEYYDVVVTEVDTATSVWVQVVGEGTTQALEGLMGEFRAHHAANPADEEYGAEVGEFCSAKFTVDDEWYRARVLEIDEDAQTANVLYVDYGNTEDIATSRLAPIPNEFMELPPQARKYNLAFLIGPSTDVIEDLMEDAADATRNLALGKKLVANVEYRNGSDQYVTLFDATDGVSVNGELLESGFARVDHSKAKRHQKKVKALIKCENNAKEEYLGMWAYGDVDYDEDPESEGPNMDKPRGNKK